MSLEQDHNQQCLEKLTWAIDQLQISVEPAKLVKISELIVQTMTGPWRYFHTPDHILTVGGSDNPIEVLAALFHDVVYYQVDRSVNFNLSYYVTPFVVEINKQLMIREQKALPQDPNFELVMMVFGFTPGQTLSPFAGLNEFLSAVVSVKVLEPFIPPSLLLQIVACIEATIPFRGASKEGLTASEILEQQLESANQTFKLGLTTVEIAQSVRSAVRMANRDVGSFANPSAAKFLDNTWSLLPETNHNFENPSSYTVSEYRVALQKMEGFMNFLKPELVFQEFKGEPEQETYQGILSRCQRNISMARLYLGSKLVTIGFLEALSLRFGRNIPLSSIMGELGISGLSVSKLEDFLPEVSNPLYPQTNIEQEALTVLEKGRTKSSNYDIKNSPLTTFMVKSLGFDEIRRLCDRSKAFFEDQISSEALLAEFNPETIDVVTTCMLRVFDSRKEALIRVTQQVA